MKLNLRRITEDHSWIDTLGQKKRCAIANRAALRVISNVPLKSPKSSQEVLIYAFYSTLISGCCAFHSNARTRKLEKSSRFCLSRYSKLSDEMEMETSPFSVSRHAYKSASNSSGSISDDLNSGSVETAITLLSSSNAVLFTVVPQRIRDKGRQKKDDELGRKLSYEAIERDLQIDNLMNAPLWNGASLPSPIQDQHELFLEELQKNRRVWGFWHDWYLAMWEGRFKDWDLASEVAQIPDDIWEEGAEAVAAEIEKRRTKLELQREIAKLKEALQQKTVVAPPSHRHHNNPPPDALISEQESIGKEITLIWEQLETLEVEIAKPSPSGVTLKVIAQALWDISVRLAEYCGTLADVALKESAKTVGGTGTKAMIGLIATTTAAQNEGVRAVANAIWEFVKTLPPG